MNQTDALSFWKKINARAFELPEQELLYLIIEENIHRVSYVKDHIGLRDVLIISEKKALHYFKTPLKLAIDVDARKGFSLLENENKFDEKSTITIEEIIDQLDLFFKETERTLYVCIGFNESVTTNTDMLLIEKAIEDGKINSINEGIRKIRRFPKWYEEIAKMPEEIVFRSYFEEHMLYAQQYTLLKTWLELNLISLLKKENLTHVEKVAFQNICHLYKGLN